MYQDSVKKITRILKSFDVQVCTKSLKTIKDILPSTNGRIEPTRRQGAIYQIPCQDCSALYIAETGCNFKTCCVEHKRDLYPRNLAKIDDNNINKKTALVKHAVKFDLNPLPPKSSNLSRLTITSFIAYGAKFHSTVHIDKLVTFQTINFYWQPEILSIRLFRSIAQFYFS